MSEGKQLHEAIKAVIPVLKRCCISDSETELGIEVLDALGADEDLIQSTFSEYFLAIQHD